MLRECRKPGFEESRREKYIFMKRIIFLAFIALLFLGQHTSANNQVAETSNLKKVPQNWSVSQYGFLIFPVAADMEEYLAYIKSKTHSEAQEYLGSISFTSLGSTLYGQSYSDQSVTEEQAINYVLNTSRVFQIHGIVIKPVSQSSCEDVKWQFVLAMSSSNLSAESYYSLSRGIYNGSVMNKYATNPPASDTLSLMQKMSQSNAGNEAFEANPCPTTLAQRRPFWGWSQASCTVTGSVFNTTTNTSYPSYTYCAPSYYVFWVNVNNGGCWVVGTSCPPPID